ncbi:MAG: DNA glycosylase [Eubacteriales bacterium]|nr:DNA glycosylase [Eubacteriales bacterium]
MHVTYEKDSAVVTLPRGISLGDTLFCGQAFRWEDLGEGRYRGIVQGLCVTAQQLPGGMRLSPCTPDAFERVWRRYFDLDYDYAACEAQLHADAVMAPMARACKGLHVLNQPLWECLITFIISSNNNIRRIAGSVEALCALAGTPIEGGYAFPEPAQLKALMPAQLKACGLGYRAAYVADTAARVCEDPSALAALPGSAYDDAKAALMRYKGVGEKVADCVLLFSCGQRGAFPVNVWVERAMRLHYPALDADRASISRFARQTYGDYAGLAQQYLFHHLRNRKGKQHA